MTALLTPFRGNEVDERQFARFIQWQIRMEIQGLVPCSLAGEAPTLTPGEQERLIRICVEIADRRVPVIAATGTNCTASTIVRTQAAKQAGAAGALIVTPYYNKPNQEGLFRHFEAIARAVDIPILLQNLPAHCGVDLLPETIGRLARIPSIVGLVEGAADPLRASRVAAIAGERFIQLCGRDASALAFRVAGGSGCVSTLANVVPSSCARLQADCDDGQYGSARLIQNTLVELSGALDAENTVAGTKYVLSLTRPDFNPAVRLPLVSLSPDAARIADFAMQSVLTTSAASAA